MPNTLQKMLFSIIENTYLQNNKKTENTLDRIVLNYYNEHCSY